MGRRDWEERVTCSACNGDGEIKGKQCRACKGKGFHIVIIEKKDRDPKPGEWD